VTGPAASPESLSLAISPCPNDTFAFHALATGAVPDAPTVLTSFADIDVLNGWAADGRHDIIKVSYAALPELLGEYALLPSGGALGRGCGPLVVSAGRTSLDGARVAIPGSRTTAYLLFRLWAADADLAGIEVLPFDQIMPAVRDGAFDAGLIIHESRFTYPSYGLEAVADLGDWWEGATGLPIPLGAILARRSLDVAGLAKTVRQSVEMAWAEPEASRSYVLEHAQEMDPDVVDAHIGLYVNAFTADLGDEGYAAVEGLLSRAEAAGLLPPPAGPLRS
jgi:1,4-dihydroxy-6-naphthoate synthase